MRMTTVSVLGSQCKNRVDDGDSFCKKENQVWEEKSSSV